MTKDDVKRCEKEIRKCLVEYFEYTETKKNGKPSQRKNQAIYSREEGWAFDKRTDLDLVMKKVVLGLYLAFKAGE